MLFDVSGRGKGHPSIRACPVASCCGYARPWPALPTPVDCGLFSTGIPRRLPWEGGLGERDGVEQLDEIWTEVQQIHHASATEVSILDRFHLARRLGDQVTVCSGEEMGVGTVVEVSTRAVVLAESSGAQSWWSYDGMDCVHDLTRARSHGRVVAQGRWWRSVRRVDVGFRGRRWVGARVQWVGADHVDLKWADGNVTIPWHCIHWARSHDAWLYEEAE